MQVSTKDDGNRNIPPFVKKAVFIASLGGILFGYDMGVISGMYVGCLDAWMLNDGE